MTQSDPEVPQQMLRCSGSRLTAAGRTALSPHVLHSVSDAVALQGRASCGRKYQLAQRLCSSHSMFSSRSFICSYTTGRKCMTSHCSRSLWSFAASVMACTSITCQNAAPLP